MLGPRIALRIDALRMPLRQSFEFAARMSVKYIELDGRNQVRASELTETGIRQLKKLLDDYDLRVGAIRFQTRRGYDNPNDLEQRVDATKATMQLAYRLGTNIVINNIGHVPEDSESQAWQDLQSVIHDLGRHGARVGTFLAAETGSEPGERLGKMLDGSDDGFVAVALNPGQLIINRESVPEAITALKTKIQVDCAVDGVLDLAAGRGIAVPLGQGTADFPELLGMLENVEYQGRLIVGRAESTPVELHDGVQYLNSL